MRPNAFWRQHERNSTAPADQRAERAELSTLASAVLLTRGSGKSAVIDRLLWFQAAIRVR